jgi:hypothetical protein
MSGFWMAKPSNLSGYQIYLDFECLVFEFELYCSLIFTKRVEIKIEMCFEPKFWEKTGCKTGAYYLQLNLDERGETTIDAPKGTIFLEHSYIVTKRSYLFTFLK